MSLQVQKIDSIRWRIGARCGSWGSLVGRGCGVISDAGRGTGVLNADPGVVASRRFSSVRRGLVIVAFSLLNSVSKFLAAEVLIADQEQHLPAGSFAAGEHLQAHELLVDLRGGQRQRSRGAVQGEQGVQAKPVEVAAVAGAVAVVGGV